LLFVIDLMLKQTLRKRCHVVIAHWRWHATWRRSLAGGRLREQQCASTQIGDLMQSFLGAASTFHLVRTQWLWSTSGSNSVMPRKTLDGRVTKTPSRLFQCTQRLISLKLEGNPSMEWTSREKRQLNLRFRIWERAFNGLQFQMDFLSLRDESSSPSLSFDLGSRKWVFPVDLDRVLAPEIKLLDGFFIQV
jgi:hypothetical protein